MQIQQIIRRNNSEIQEINGNIVINTDHNILKNRDLPNQHPISSISNLNNVLDTIPSKLSDLQEDINHVTVTEEEKGQITENKTDIINTKSKVTEIEEKIPNQATSENKLTDTNFVNSTVATATATFKGTWNSIDDFPTSGVDDNDYAFYRHTDSEGNTVFDRYKYTDNQWEYEYTLNNSSFTAAQWASINSGITQGLVGQITTNQTNITNLQNTIGEINTALDDINGSEV